MITHGIKISSSLLYLVDELTARIQLIHLNHTISLLRRRAMKCTILTRRNIIKQQITPTNGDEQTPVTIPRSPDSVLSNILRCLEKEPRVLGKEKVRAENRILRLAN